MVDTLQALQSMGTAPELYVVKSTDGLRRKILVVYHNGNGFAALLKGDPTHTTIAEGMTKEILFTNVSAVLFNEDNGFQHVSFEPYFDPRPPWEQYFMDLAKAASKRSTCPRKAVGAVIVRNNRILTTGYNGAIPGMPHCIEVGCDLIELADGSVNCHRIVHAEMNALMQAAQHGICIAGSDLYVNTYPCYTCFKHVASAKIVRIFYGDAYRNDLRVERSALQVGITLTQITVP